MQKVLWFSSHLLAVLVHIGLVIVSIYGFIECGFSSVSGSGRSNQTERCTDEPKNTIVPWASFGMGVAITAFNVGYAAVVYLLPRFIKESESRHSKARVLLATGVFVNFLFALADISLAGVSGSMADDFKPLTAVCVLATLASIVLTSTITVDVLKIKELGRLKQHEKDAALQKASSESSPVNIAYPQTINRYTNEAV